MNSKAYVLIKTQIGQPRKVYEELEKHPEVKYLDAVTGPYDIITLIESSDFNTLANFVLAKIQRIEGVADTITCNCISFEN